MDLETLLSYPWHIMAPEFTILIVATLLSLIDIFMKKKMDRNLIGWLAIAGVVIALIFTVNLIGEPVQMILHETFRIDSFAIGFKLILLIGTIFVLLMGIDYSKEELKLRGEFFYLILTALLGGMIVTSSADMITMFVGLELLSFSSYILAGLRKDNIHSNESAFKYVVNGGVASAITLFGMSYVYGLTGQTNLFLIADALQNPVVLQNNFLLMFAFFLVFIGLSFKIAAAPFHMWSPDVYQGAATPVTAFLSVVSKATGFAFIIRLMIIVFGSAAGISLVQPVLLDAQIYIAVLAAITMIIGNVMALKQTNVKRMFAYSSVAQAGYILVPFVTYSVFILENVWFYLFVYMFMNLGAFIIIQLVTSQTGTEELKSFGGLYRRAPLLAIFMALFLISLAGIPPAAGFMAKFYIFLASISTKHYVLAAIMIATSVISYFYYFSIIAQMFFRPKEEESPIRVPVGLWIVLVISAVAVLLMGIFPDTVFDFINTNLNLSELTHRL